MPSWVGDAVMATPALRLLRELLPGALIGALARPGIDALLAGSEFFDELHTGRAVGVMGPKRLAAKLRPRRYDTALLLTNSFSTALITRLAGVPNRIGYERDGRGMLLTDPIEPLRRRDLEPFKRSPLDPAAWAPVPACDYYFRLAAHLLKRCGIDPGEPGPLELPINPDEEIEAAELLERAGIDREDQRTTPIAMLNPGANNDAKRWPPDRFAALADYLAAHHGMTVLINAGPSEHGLADVVASLCRDETDVIDLPKAAGRRGMTLGLLKGVLRKCRLLVTNDTGPRHIAAALGVPVVTLFGPTDHRWTTIPFQDELRLLADPTLPPEEVANDHPQRCRIDRIGLGDVVAAANTLLTNATA